jgi:hypothetical protein
MSSLEEQAMGFWKFGGACMRCHDEDGPWGQVKAGPHIGEWWCEPCLARCECGDVGPGDDCHDECGSRLRHPAGRAR